MTDPIQREAELLARIMLLEKAKEREPVITKPVWQRFLESTGGAALITVILGGIIGTLITNSIQTNQQERERKMKLYTLSLSEQNNVTSASMQLLGETLYAANSLTEIKGPAFAYIDGDTASNREIENQKRDIRRKFNSACENWSKKGLSQGFFLGLNSGENSKIQKKWDSIAQEVDSFLDYAHSLEEGGYNIDSSELRVDKISKMTAELIAMLREEQRELWSELNNEN